MACRANGVGTARRRLHDSAKRGAEPDEHVYHLRVVERGLGSQRVRDGPGGELRYEHGAEGLIADGLAEELEPIAEALHLGREGVRGVIAEEHGLILFQVQLKSQVRPHVGDDC